MLYVCLYTAPHSAGLSRTELACQDMAKFLDPPPQLNVYKSLTGNLCASELV